MDLEMPKLSALVPVPLVRCRLMGVKPLPMVSGRSKFIIIGRAAK
jgi:hypothetical protein